MITRLVPAFLLLIGAAGPFLPACSGDPNSANPGVAPDSQHDETKPPGEGGVERLPDGALVGDDASPDAGPRGYCPPATPGDSLYCQRFDSPPESVGTWTVYGEPTVEDGGVVMTEDRTQFWSPPSSRYLSNSGSGMLRGTAAGPLPVKEVTLRFRVRPRTTPNGTYGAHLAYVKLGDSTLTIAWLDYGRIDPSKAGTKGYALIHHVVGSARPDEWTPLGGFPAQNIWSAVELTLRSTGAVTVSFDGVSAGTLTATVSPSTTGSFGFGPYLSSPTTGPTYMSGNIDDVAAIIRR